MTIYTIEAHGRPVVVVSVGGAPPLEGGLATKPGPLRATRDPEAQPPADVGEHLRRRAMDEALDTWLGEDLSALESGGRPLWDGDRDALRVREASPEEAAIFQVSREHAVRRGELDAREEDWVTFLVPVTDPAADEGGEGG